MIEIVIGANIVPTPSNFPKTFNHQKGSPKREPFNLNCKQNGPEPQPAQLISLQSPAKLYQL